MAIIIAVVYAFVLGVVATVTCMSKRPLPMMALIGAAFLTAALIGIVVLLVAG